MPQAEYPWLKHYEEGVPHSIQYPSVPLHRTLEDTAARFPDHTALAFLGNKVTYRQLNAQADRFASALQGLGVGKGDRVAVILPNCPQFVVAFYGTLKAGGVVVPTNPLYVEREVEHQLRDSGARVVVTLTKFYPTVQKVQPKTAVEHVVATNIKEYFPAVKRLLFTLLLEAKDGHRVPLEKRPDHHWFGDLMRGAEAAPGPVKVGPDDVALFQYTGGTTGVPKGAVLTHYNLLANTIQCRRWITTLVEGQDVMLGVLPFFHVYGMTTAMSMSVYAGATIVLLPRFELKEVLATIKAQRPTLFPGVPTMYVAINNFPQVGDYDLRSIKACLSGAAPLPVEVQKRFEELTGGRLVEGYGLTEAAPVTHANPVYGLRKEGSIGVPFPDVEARIMDVETGQVEMPVGETGELSIRAPQVMREYWGHPEDTSLALRDGWLYTGDIARMDEDGYFYIVDRKKDMILAGGFNIYPREIEEVLYQHPKVKEAVALGVPDAYRGETPKVYVVLKEGQSATEDEILGYCRENLAKYKVPTIVEFRKELPKTLVGKVLRRVLREEGSGSEAQGSGTRNKGRGTTEG
ncbi:MAG TPA: long-chain fatty acid--CoA ligase [Dehalococcoidia bacterium]|nr:long-chain fatty acid--CoA ligase [Dehalococcoidia bacterium]